MMLRILFLVFFYVISFTSAQSAEKSLEGLWATEGREAVVQIYACGDANKEYCGRFYWFKEEDPLNPERDDNNPNKSKRDRLLCGMKFMGGFKNDGEGHYGGGWVYSPRHGAKYSAFLRMLDVDRLEMRGYLLFSFLGESQTWTRDTNAKPCAYLP